MDVLLAQQADPHYKITSWTTDDGLPGNACIKIFQDKDGFLWIGGFDGLIRFDGTRFIIYNKNNKLSTNFALSLAGDRNGNLWVGTDHGLVGYNSGKISESSDKEHSFYIQSLFLDDASQKLWIGTRNAGLYTYDVASQKYDLVEGLRKDDIINDILKDKEGNVWIASEKNGLMQYRSNKWYSFGKSQGLLSNEIESLHLTADNQFYVGTTSGLYVKEADQFKENPKFKNVRINKVTSNKQGALWIGTVNGLYIKPTTSDWIFFNRNDGLSNNDIRDIYFDEDGTTWLGTYRGGMNQMRETKFATYFRNQDERIEAVGAIGQRNDELLIGTTEGELFTLKNEQLKKYPLRTPIHQRIYSLICDNKKNIWAASYDGLLLIQPDGRERLFTEKDGLQTNQTRIIFQDRKHNYWIGTRNAGLIKMTIDSDPSRPRFEQYKLDELNKVSSTFIMNINEDSKGNLLICSNSGGLTILSPDGLKNFNKKNGMESNTCFVSYEDKQDVIWISTTDGLTRLKEGELFTFTQKDKMPVENPMDIIEDNFGYLWLPTQKGTIRVNKRALNDYAEHRVNSLDWKMFDKNNDLEKAECTGTGHGYKTRDGKIWLPMIGGLVSVDPKTVQIGKKAPRIYIDKFVVDEKEVDANQQVIVNSGNHRIAVEYLAQTLLYPNSARYKYMLRDYDEDWIDAGSSRQAVYTSLPHGQYYFSVMACNNDGVWTTIDSKIPIIIEPHFYQTWWFIVLSIIASLGLILSYTRIRTAAIKHRAGYLEQLVNER
ncbi:MAG: two-component regulator propeller domain-containing protein, partial [Cyclobacteriaceae bacterium]